MIIGNNNSLLQRIIDAIGQEFVIKDFGCLYYFLGFDVRSTHTGLILSQGKYAKNLVAIAGFGG